MRILIGEISSYKAIVIAKYLRRNYNNRIIVITYDYNRFTSLFHTRYSHKNYLLEKVSPSNYLHKIAELIKKEKIDFFFPVHSNYLGEIIKEKEKFGNSLNYLGCSGDYQKLHEKKSLYDLASKLGIPIPLSYASLEESAIPFVCKPIEGSSAKGVFYVNNENERNRYLKRKFEKYIFQEYVDGVGCGYSVYAQEGKIKSGYGHLRLAEFFVSGGASIYRESFYKDKMKDIAAKILKEIPWTGFAMFEFKLTPNGGLKLIEVNPRIWGSINQGLQNGVNFFESILGKGCKQTLNYKREVKTYLSPQVYLSFILYMLSGNFKPFISFVKNIRYNKADVSVFDDPKGWLSMILRKLL